VYTRFFDYDGIRTREGLRQGAKNAVGVAV